MWFAALGSYQGAPWLVNLAYKLLSCKHDAIGLLDQSTYPFPEYPPKLIRMKLYSYDFTRLNSTWARTMNSTIVAGGKDDAVWSKEFVRDYLPPVALADVRSFLEHHGLIPQGSQSSSGTCDSVIMSEPSEAALKLKAEGHCRGDANSEVRATCARVAFGVLLAKGQILRGLSKWI